MKPSEIFISELSDSYEINTTAAERLIEKLEFKKDELQGFTEEQKNIYRAGEEFVKLANLQGKTPTEFLNEVQQLTSKQIMSKPTGQTTPPSSPSPENPFPSKSRHQKVKGDENTPNETEDDEELIPASIKTEVLEKKRADLQNLLEQKIEQLTQIEALKAKINESEKYSFIWFKSLLEFEYLQSCESKSRGREISIRFGKVEKDPASEKIIILKYPSRYIPYTIEDVSDLPLQLHFSDETQDKKIFIEVVSVKEYTLHARLKSVTEIQGINLANVTNAVIEMKNPIFLLEKLKEEFCCLPFEDQDNLHARLTEKLEFIFGPPGTGKTTYLAKEKILPLMNRSEDLKVLVLTPTNKAADVLVKKIIETSRDDSYYVWLVRFGTTGDNEIEQSGLLKDQSFDISKLHSCTVVTTVARFPYDGFRGGGDHDWRLRDYAWDVIVFDEASMIMLASIIYVLYQQPACQFIVGGDPFQIQPVVIAEEWKEENIYTLVGLNKPDSFKTPETTPHTFPVEHLKTQYRSIPPVGELFSQFTYNGNLTHQRTHDDKKFLKIRGLDLKEITVITFPVNRFESVYRSQKLDGGSSYHIYAAIFAVELALYMAKELANSDQGSWKIGIICPYAAQATLVDKMLTAMFSPQSSRVEIFAGTIHSFQGDECHIILDLLNPPPTISPNIFLNKQNILNVSISRARDYLILIRPEEIEELGKIKRITNLLSRDEIRPYVQELKSADFERIMFNHPDFIRENAFMTTHQKVNVYSKPEKKYEIRCEESAIDVQLFL